MSNCMYESHLHNTSASMKKIWIINEYAMPPEYEARMRSISMAKYLKTYGYDVTIIGGSELHGLGKNLMKKKKGYILREYDGQRFAHIGLPHYKGNGASRAFAMVWFQWKLSLYARRLARQIGKPDVILYDDWAIPLCPAARLKRIFHAKLIKEVRDLWPESIVAYGIAGKNNPLIKLLYQLEKKLYKKADKIVFTMEGGKDYIIEKGWDKDHGGSVDLAKVYHINNGIDLEVFNYNKEHYTFADPDLDDPDTFKVVYTGSVRKANGVDILVEVAQRLEKEHQENITILIYGDGDFRKELEQKIKNSHLKNIKYKGKVEKKYIPYILSKSDLNLLNYAVKTKNVLKYGGSQNKLFDYFASGKPVLSNIEISYSVIRRFQCGYELEKSSAENYADYIKKISKLPKTEYHTLESNTLTAIEAYDFKILTNKLIQVINGDDNRCEKIHGDQ